MPAVRITGPAHIADRAGTHAPGEVIEYPSAELLALATAKTKNPETDEPYCTIVGADTPPDPPAKAAPEKA